MPRALESLTKSTYLFPMLCRIEPFTFVGLAGSIQDHGWIKCSSCGDCLGLSREGNATRSLILYKNCWGKNLDGFLLCIYIYIDSKLKTSWTYLTICTSRPPLKIQGVPVLQGVLFHPLQRAWVLKELGSILMHSEHKCRPLETLPKSDISACIQIQTGPLHMNQFENIQTTAKAINTHQKSSKTLHWSTHQKIQKVWNWLHATLEISWVSQQNATQS